MTTVGTAGLYEAELEDPKDIHRAYAFCRRVAQERPEGLWAPRLIPGTSRRHLSAAAAFLRVAAPPADVAAEARRRTFLEDWRRQLAASDREPPRHPVLAAVVATLRELDLPREPFDDLLGAFLQDGRRTRYATYKELQGFLRRYAEPVGRIALMIRGCRDARRLELSDRLCSALQMTRWMRDVASDLQKDHVYFTGEDFLEAGYTEADLRMGVVNEGFRTLMKQQWKRARSLFEESQPLAEALGWPLSWDVKLAWLSGNAMLRSIQRLGFDTLHQRPARRRWDWPRLMTGAALWRRS